MTSLVELGRRRLAGDHDVDEWGLDPDLVSAVAPLLGLRWSVDAAGAALLPDDGPALLVHNRGIGPSASFAIARAVRREAGRHLRTAGAPDVAVVGPALRRLGAVLRHPDEVESVLRAGHLVAVGHRLSPVGSSLGELVPFVAAARSLGAPVHPVGLIGRELRRRWRVEIGAAVPTVAPGPLGDDQTAEAVVSGVRDLLVARRSG